MGAAGSTSRIAPGQAEYNRVNAVLRNLRERVVTMLRCIKAAPLLTVMLVLFASLVVVAQQNSKRLILKDGSYQTATKWEFIGDRVRYYSAERYLWEELPKDMVDWPATEKYNQDRDVQRSSKAAPDERENDTDSPETPTVAPGLRLPDGGGVFLLDAFQTQPQLLQLEQNGGELNKHLGKNILRAAINPLALSSKQTVELRGERARVQSHVNQPAIFVNVDTSPLFPEQQSQRAGAKSQPETRYGIVRVQVKKGLRVLGDLNIAVYGKVSQKENWIKTTSTVIGDWVRVVPDESMPAGEYAVVELLEKNQINIYVWDFGVDPSAPVNPNAWTPRHSAPGQENTPPVLEKRPK